MLLARRWAGALVVEDTVFVIGGIGGKGGTYEKRLDSVESLELTEDGAKRWRQLSPMSTPRSSHTCEVMDGLIYVVGGGDGKDWLCSAEVYDPKKNVWRSIADLSAKRWKCGLVELGGCLYAVGGMDSPRAGFWGAPLNTGIQTFFPLLKAIIKYLFIQLSATVQEPISGRLLSQCTRPGLVALWWLTRGASMWGAALVRTRPSSAPWRVTTRTLTRYTPMELMSGDKSLFFAVDKVAAHEENLRVCRRRPGGPSCSF